MEKNIDRKVLSFSKGMTNTPSDLLCEDSELAECDGFIYRDGEMKPIQSPKKIGNIPYKIMYVHKQADYENIIAYDEDKTIYWYKKDTDGTISSKQGSFDIGATTDIQSVGSTLVCATSEGLHYLLFKGSVYKDLGTELPKPNFRPILTETKQAADGYSCTLGEIVGGQDTHAYYVDNEFVGYYNNADDAPSGSVQGEYHYLRSVKTGKYDDFLNAVEGCVSKGINGEKDKNNFLFPFFTRYALKLYDGTYARISAPIACYPTITRNCCFDVAELKTADWYYKPYVSSMKYTCTIDGIDDWKDIVKELVVFVSDDVNTFSDMSSTKQSDWYIYSGHGGTGITYVDYLGGKKVYDSAMSQDVILASFKTDSEIIEELLTKTQFYKIASLKVSDSSNFTTEEKDLPIKKNIISTLTTQEQLKVDDYYGWATCKYEKIFTYNQRLNAFSTERKPWKGFCSFIASKKESNGIVYYVHIEAPTMDAWVKSDTTKYMPEYAIPGWFFYPDTNATEVIIYNTSTKKSVHLLLEGHSLLNGAYTFSNLPTSSTAEWEDITLPTVDKDAHEILNSNIYTSVVNNPFVFEASGDNTVGTGKILGIIANTEAVSQGQFGQYPLMVFTDEGIYGMSVSSEGLYSATYPISREACLDNSPLVPTDKLVYFVSKKGLMAASGGSVGCMSDMLRGRTPRNFATVGDGKFLEFLKDCKIAYDYRDSLLRIFSKDKAYQYIYNMIDKTFSMVNSGIMAQSVVNDYPDNLIQDTSGNVYSLTGKSDINDDENTYKGSFVTRPLKLGGSMNLKSLRVIKHLVDTDNGNIALEIYGSNDCKHWQKLISLGGKPYKYFTFVYHLEDLKATDAFSGSIVEIQTRRQDKIR